MATTQSWQPPMELTGWVSTRNYLRPTRATSTPSTPLFFFIEQTGKAEKKKLEACVTFRQGGLVVVQTLCTWVPFSIQQIHEDPTLIYDMGAEGLMSGLVHEWKNRPYCEGLWAYPDTRPNECTELLSRGTRDFDITKLPEKTEEEKKAEAERKRQIEE